MEEKKEEKGLKMEEIRAYMEAKQKEQEEKERQALVKAETTEAEKKSITDLSAKDIKYQVDNAKSIEQQAEDVVGAMATASAVQDEQTAKELTEKKAEELKAVAEAKKKRAQTEQTKAVVAQQEANHSRNETVLQTFGVTKALPDVLLKIMVILFSPIYIILTILIGIPCGIVKVLIDNIDNILVRYESADEKIKPRLKFTVWAFLIVATVAVIAFAVLKAFGKI